MAKQSLKKNNSFFYFLFDTETGGANPKQHSLLTTYGLVLNKNLKVVSSIDLKTKPNGGAYQVQADALRVNKIDLTKHDKDAKTYQEASQVLEHFLVGKGTFGTSKFIPVGWNVKFDISFLQEHLLPPAKWDKYFSRDTIELKTLVHYMVLCNKLKLKDYGPEMHLFELVQHFNINIDGKELHDAKHDTEAEYALFKELIDLNKEATDNK